MVRQKVNPQNTRQAHQSAQLIKPPFVERFLALFIDFLLSMVLSLIPVLGAIAGALYMTLRDGLPFGSLGRKLIGTAVFDTKKNVVSPDYGTSFARNWMFAFMPLSMCIYIVKGGFILVLAGSILTFFIVLVEAILVLYDERGCRLGDKIAGTFVIKM